MKVSTCKRLTEGNSVCVPKLNIILNNEYRPFTKIVRVYLKRKRHDGKKREKNLALTACTQMLSSAKIR